VAGLTLVGEGLNETVNPVLRKRRLLPVDMPAKDPSSYLAEGDAAALGSGARDIWDREDDLRPEREHRLREDESR
jgi:peptide/nickel transport system permease protein